MFSHSGLGTQEKDRISKAIKKVTFEGTVIGSGSFERMLFECAEVESFDLTGLQTGSVTDMTDVFAG